MVFSPRTPLLDQHLLLPPPSPVDLASSILDQQTLLHFGSTSSSSNSSSSDPCARVTLEQLNNATHHLHLCTTTFSSTSTEARATTKRHVSSKTALYSTQTVSFSLQDRVLCRFQFLIHPPSLAVSLLIYP